LNRTRSTRRSPVVLSSSYFTLEPIGISMMQLKISGACGPSSTSCQGFIMILLRLPEFPELFRRHHPFQQCWSSRRKACDFDRADRPFLELDIEIAIASQQEGGEFREIGLMTDQQGAVELIRAEFKKYFGMTAFSSCKRASGRERFDNLDSVLQVKHFGHGLCGLACTQQRTGQDQVEFQFQLAQSDGGLLHLGASFHRQRTVSVLDHATFAQISGDPMSHQIKLDQFSRPFYCHLTRASKNY